MGKTALRALMLALALAGLTAGPAGAKDAPIHTGTFSNTALEGYDPVAYFTDGKPVEGRKTFTTSWMGADWRFASAENLEAFKADPARYAPQFGGYCAWAVSQGYTASGDPLHWAVTDGKLYVNYNKEIQDRWNADRTGFIQKAEANWPTVLGK